ncbi:MAG: cobalamin-binding protein [Firmicutes bacterium]|nr:cobalamin-binding protein [Bacillota bacterium]
MAILQDMANALIAGNADEVTNLTNQALAADIAPGTIIKDGFIPGMAVIGERFKNNEIYVPEVLIAARAMHAGLSIVKPLLSEAEAKDRLGTVCIGTVKGDLHDIGKNLVAMMLEGAGFEVIDLGVDVAPEKFIDAIKEHSATHVALSALLTTTMVTMKQTVQALKDAGLKDSVKVMVGGAPVTQSFADEIGADGYAPDSSTAVDVAKQLIGAG